MLSDLRYACRSLAKSPGFTVVAIVTLAIAIGINAAIFSLVNGLILRPSIPYKPAEVVNIFTACKEADRKYRQFSYAEFTALRAANPIFSDVAAFNFTIAGIGSNDTRCRRFVYSVSENFFSLVGVQPAAGRFFTAAESKPNSNTPVAIASFLLWKRMGGRPDFIGSTIHVNGRPFTVIGVTPRGFAGMSPMLAPELWLPLGTYSQLTNPLADNGQASDLLRPNNYSLNLMGRLNSGIDLPSATTLLPALSKRLTALQPPENATTAERELQIQTPSRFSISTEPQDDGSVTTLATLILGMAAIVLLIACLNLANMFLARGTSRAKEIAIRLSLGAPRWRVVWLLLVEGLLLAFGGGILGMLLAQWINDLLIASLQRVASSTFFSLALDLRPDGPVFGVTFLCCVVASLIFSLGPALKSVRLDLVHDLKQQGGDSASIGRWNRFFSARHCLVMTQISLSLVLLFSGGLFFRSALNAAGLDLGFNPTGSAVAELDFSLGHTLEAIAQQKMSSLLARTQQEPGVRSAALSTLLPYSNFTNGKKFIPAESAPTTETNAQQPGTYGVFCAITPDYFDAIGVHLLLGRTFSAVEAENRNAPSVAIIDAQMAQSLFPNGNALGRRIRDAAGGQQSEMEIVGIVSNHRQKPRTGPADAHLFQPLARGYNPNVFLTVRYASDNPKAAAANIAELRKTFRDFDPDLPVLSLTPFTDLVDGNFFLWVVKFGAVLFGAFGSVALLLAVVGVYGVKAYAVAQRTHEIGVHMALGAMPRNVFALIMKQGAFQILFAMSAGIILSLLVGKALSSHLFGVSAVDLFVLGASIAILAASALLACYLPARRATQVNPIEALRSE